MKIGLQFIIKLMKMEEHGRSMSLTVQLCPNIFASKLTWLLHLPKTWEIFLTGSSYSHILILIFSFSLTGSSYSPIVAEGSKKWPPGISLLSNLERFTSKKNLSPSWTIQICIMQWKWFLSRTQHNNRKALETCNPSESWDQSDNLNWL